MTIPRRLSNFSGRRLRARPTLLALWAVAALLAAAITVAALWPQRTARDDVNAYIHRVDTITHSFDGRYKAIDTTFRTFSFSAVDAERQLPQVKASARQLTLLRERVAAVPAPAQAAVLRRRLVAFLRQEEGVAWELADVSGYLPKLAAAERPLAPASKRMRTALQTKGATPKEQAAALRTYAAAVAGVATALAGVHAPTLFAAPQHLQVNHLRTTAADCRRLAAALEANDRKAVKSAVEALARTPSGTAATARAAVTAYNRRVARIRTLGRAVELERSRLGGALG